MPAETAPIDLGKVASDAPLAPNPDRLVEDSGKAEAMADAEDELRTSAVEKRVQAFDMQFDHSRNPEEPGFFRREETDEAKELKEQAQLDDWRADFKGEDAAEQYELDRPSSIGEKQRDQLAKEAAAYYEGEQRELYLSDLRRAVGTIEAIRRGLIDPFGARVYLEKPLKRLGRKLEKKNQEKLRAAVYEEAIVPVPEEDEFVTSDGYVSADNEFLPGVQLELDTATKHSHGVTITEQRFYRKRLGGIKRSFVGRDIVVGSTKHYDEIMNPDQLGEIPLP